MQSLFCCRISISLVFDSWFLSKQWSTETAAAPLLSTPNFLGTPMAFLLLRWSIWDDFWVIRLQFHDHWPEILADVTLIIDKRSSTTKFLCGSCSNLLLCMTSVWWELHAVSVLSVRVRFLNKRLDCFIALWSTARISAAITWQDNRQRDVTRFKITWGNGRRGLKSKIILGIKEQRSFKRRKIAEIVLISVWYFRT